MRKDHSPPPPPQSSEAVAEAVTPKPKKKPWSKPTIRIHDGVTWVEGGPTQYGNIESTQYRPIS